ncbi:MAG: hypothetical protein RLZZ253_187 [Verrucomicrobiota bacterium]
MNVRARITRWWQGEGKRRVLRMGAVFWRALKKYNETDGEQRAASFAYYAFFALFPLMVLLITLGAGFLGDEGVALEKITGQVAPYFPLDTEFAGTVVESLRGVMKGRRSAGVIAFGMLAWSALRFFQGLVHGVNRAWGTREYPWWRMPIQNLLMVLILASALLMGIVVPAVLDQVQEFYWSRPAVLQSTLGFMPGVLGWARLLVPGCVLFYGFSMFYKYAPRRRTTFREVWGGAFFVTVGLHGLRGLFVLYTSNITNFNALYGTFGGVLALLLWIYLSGAVIIFGGCLCAAGYEIRGSLTDQAVSNRSD